MPAFAVSLKDVPVIEPTNLHAFVKGRAANDPLATPAQIEEGRVAKEKLVVLGKALFWDMQVGSDDVQACASCHFNAGADPRPTNQLNPGGIAPNATADTVFGNSGQAGIPGPNMAPWNFGFGPNMRLLPNHFPFHLRENPTAPLLAGLVPDPAADAVGTLRDTNDVSSSQGVREQDLPFPFNDGVFNFQGANQRRVEPRNAPTMINAAFSLDMFWDGRGSFIFNGQNPFGFRDRDATVRRNLGTAGTPNVQNVKVRIPFASHASQSVGPPLSGFEMAGTFRTFPELADKMLAPTTKVMALQVVHPQDGVLGPYAKASLLPGNTNELNDVAGMKSLDAPGTDLTYLELIQDTFREEWWNGGPAQVRENFALFFGLSMQAYQSTLIADETPLDRYLGTDADVRGNGAPIPADPNALTQQELLGLDIFQGTNLSGLNGVAGDPDPAAPPLVVGGCINCHILPETTNHTVRLALAGPGAPVNFPVVVNEGGPTDLENVVVPNALIEPMPMGVAQPVDPAILAGFEDPAPFDPAVGPVFNLTPQFFVDNPTFLFGFGLYDVGFYNLGVRPTGEDLSRANGGPATTGFPGGLPLAYVTLADMIRDGVLDPVEHLDVTKFVPLIPDQANLVEVPLVPPLTIDVDGVPTEFAFAVINGIPTQGLNPVTQGAFKVPNLRNQEFQGPYFHNGGAATLRQVVEFYVRGGDFPNTNLAHLDADIAPIIGMDVNGAPLPGEVVTAEARVQALTAFLANGLTDQRVAKDQAPFDHPQLVIPEGANGRTPDSDRAFELKATGAAGAETSIPRFLNMDPQATGDPTQLGRISGRVVVEGSGAGISGITVSAYQQDVNDVWQIASSTHTDGGGFYTLQALTPGSYKVRFFDELGGYIGETFDNASFVLAPGTGTNVSVIADDVTTNVNAALTPLPTDSYEPDNTTATALPVAGDVQQQRTLTMGDRDWIRIAGQQGNTYTMETSGTIPVDTYLELFAADGTLVAANNDGGAGTFSRISYQAPANGDLFVRVRGLNASVAGPYVLTLSATDVTPPVTTSSATPQMSTPAAIQLTATDDWSGIKSTEYRIDGGAWTSGTSLTVSSLGSHTLEYRSVDNKDNTESVKTASFNVTVAPTHLVASASHATPKYGRRSTVSTTLRRDSVTGAPLAGETVRLESSANGKSWKTIATLSTNAAGSVSRSVFSRTTMYYRFTYAGKAPLYGAKIGTTVKVSPQVSLTKPSVPSVARANRTFRSTGTLKPKHAGGSTQIRIRAYRFQGGRWVYKKSFRTTATSLTSSSRYTGNVRLGKGVWRIRAAHPADRLNGLTNSAYSYLVVR